jgi:hypothetical protein
MEITAFGALELVHAALWCRFRPDIRKLFRGITDRLYPPAYPTVHPFVHIELSSRDRLCFQYFGDVLKKKFPPIQFQISTIRAVFGPRRQESGILKTRAKNHCVVKAEHFAALDGHGEGLSDSFYPR